MYHDEIEELNTKVTQVYGVVKYLEGFLALPTPNAMVGVQIVT